MSALRDGIRQVHVEAGGMLELQIIQRDDLPGLMLDALAGSAEAVQLLRLTNDTVTNIEAAPRRKPMLCGSCPRALRGGRYAVIVARPACDDRTRGLAMAICPECGPTHDAIQLAARVALARIWPNLRPVAITHPIGGQA